MVGSDFDEEEEDQFFDAHEEFSSGSDCDTNNTPRNVVSVSNCFKYDVWTKCPDSIFERRRTFMRMTGLSASFRSFAMDDVIEDDKSEPEMETEPEMGLVGTTKNLVSENVNGGSENGFLSGHSSTSSLTDEAVEEVVVEDGDSGKNLVCSVQDLENPTQSLEYVMEIGQDGGLGTLREVSSNRLVSLEEFERSFSSRLVQQLLHKESEVKNLADGKKKVKRSWIQRLGSRVRIPSNRCGANAFRPEDFEEDEPVTAMRRVRVNPTKKHFKELTSLHTRQEFQAHRGSILTMKFSLDGQHLATAGKDGVVRVWKVNEDARLDDTDIPDVDPSCLYFPMNQPSKLAAIDANKDKLKKLKKSNSLACAVLPPEVFWMLEKPLHEFQGHSGEVLDLSWSKEGYLLSSSVDKTVRLWKVGSDRCLKVFSHKNYVTCVSFDPVDSDFFISGSIDGMVRIWEVPGCQVINYIDVREIVTALSYRPNGKEAIIGSIYGNCFFVNIVDDRFHLEGHINLKGKKKSMARRITGFQFCPTDPKKVLVTAADSLVKVLGGEEILCKFKGPRKTGNHVAASFTSDGKHIISATEDSNVCVWNYNSLDRAYSGTKKIRSFESFMSENASIAIPWCGMTIAAPEAKVQRAHTIGSGNIWGSFFENKQKVNSYSALELERKKSVDSPDCFPLTRSMFSDSLPKGSVTWPEEKMTHSCPLADSTSVSCKSEYKLLKSAWQSMLSSDNMWGVVIVTAGWDGRIRTFQNYGLPVRL